MAQRIFFDSSYKYTDPIRLFKANDPIYYQVDNIPLAQLEENCNFLKSQIEGLLGASGSAFEIDRSEFSELKPYVDGTNNKVKVKPGKFTARINDAFTVDPLQFITQVMGFSVPEFNTWSIETNIGSQVNAVLQKFKTKLAANATNMNGLVERTFTFPMRDLDFATQFLLEGQPGTDPAYGYTHPGYPNFEGKLWREGVTDTSAIRYLQSVAFPSNGLFAAGSIESDFIKRWRGVARTSIVNVEEELEISIPAFDEDDFFYYNEAGDKIALTANHRIDLVFIYSKPIDASSTTISKFVNNTPTTLTQPTLGIVKGAGIGVSLKTGPSTPKENVKLVDAEGNPLMLANPSDEEGTNIGFGSIKGSFPSPDDLMNISPLICENIETDNYVLIGQSVLPVAYVVVRKNATINSTNTSVISITDLIDIRPFFRTAELSYNERAGLAAATPQVSIANPVASEGLVENIARKLYDDYTARINQLQNVNSSPLTPRIVGTGYVKGGFHYGVEAVLEHYIRSKYNITSSLQARNEVKNRYGYPTGLNINPLPDWDVAEWCARGNFIDKGAYPNDRINFHTFGPNFNGAARVEFAAYANDAITTRIDNLGTDKVHGGQSNVDKGNTCIYFVKKRIQLDKSQIQWASDYHVNVQLWNCAPLSCRTHRDGNNMAVASNASVWVDKRPNEFTIYVSWVASDQYNQGISSGASEPGDSNVRPHQARNEGSKFAGFSVINNDILSHDYVHRVVDGESSAGVAIYPTVYFQVYGIPAGFSPNNVNMYQQAPILQLV